MITILMLTICTVLLPIPLWGALQKAPRRTIFHAVSHGDHQTVQSLLQAKSPIDQQNNDGLTPLAFAAHRGKLPIVRLLLSSGAHGEIADHLGRTPIHHAVTAPIKSTVAMKIVYDLVLAGADIHHKDVNQQSAWEKSTFPIQSQIALSLRKREKILHGEKHALRMIHMGENQIVIGKIVVSEPCAEPTPENAAARFLHYAKQKIQRDLLVRIHAAQEEKQKDAAYVHIQDKQSKEDEEDWELL